jgi:4-hydroxy-2-oxoheptanedioate aldolase
MDLPENRFRKLLKQGRHQYGIWNSIGGSIVAEVLAGAGYDWVLIDTEHSPVEVTGALASLQAIAAYPQTSAIVRPAINDVVLIKRHLDQGAQTLLLPYVQSRAEAEAAVAAMLYPPRGVRGVAGLTRAARFGRVANYHIRAESELCLLVQVETAAALERLEDIASVPGVDGVFFGPADLAASMGLTGQPGHPDVCAAVLGGIARLKKIGVPAGVLTMNRDFARQCIAAGTLFTALDQDLGVLTRGVDALRREFGD